MQQMKVYSGKGDDGSTGLYMGGRVSKSSAAVDAYGIVDEAVAALGVARAEATGELAGEIMSLQRELFVVGAELATDPSRRGKLEPGQTCVSEEMADAVGKLVAALEERLPELREFVIPGDNRLSAALDLARTVIRKAERACVALADSGELDNPHLLRYLNRLGDLAFLMAREAGPDTPTRSGD